MVASEDTRRIEYIISDESFEAMNKHAGSKNG